METNLECVPPPLGWHSIHYLLQNGASPIPSKDCVTSFES